MNISVDIVLLILGGVLMLLGIVGCIAPFLPGPPLCYGALLLAQATSLIQFSSSFLWLWAAIVIVTIIIEFLIPIWGTKQYGGTRAGVWGSTIGLLIGMFFFPPMGIIIGTILGAFIGELLVNSSDTNLALKAALGALLGFFVSTGLKLTVCFIMTFYFIKEIVTSISA